MKHVIVTGGYGFIGGHLLRALVARKDVELIQVIDNETEGFDPANKEMLLASGKKVKWPTELSDPDTIFHLAAASHVDSVNGHPLSSLENVEAMYDTLQRTHEHNARLVVLSTDEVYGATWPNGPGRTCGPLDPSSPYSASKAACDMLAQGWAKTYGLDVAILRAGNNYGTGQHKSKFIPKLIARIKTGTEFPLYGNGDYYRSWQPVEYTVACLIEAATNEQYSGIEHATSGAQYLSNMQIIERLQYAGVPVKVRHVADRPAHDQSYYCSTTFGALESEIVPKQKNIVDFIISQL